LSTTSRLISGSAAHWIQIGVTVFSQLAFVPIYLSHWTPSTFGIWLAIQALMGVITRLDFGYHEYIAYELFRCGQDRFLLSKFLWSGTGVSVLINIAQLLFIFLIPQLGILPFFLGNLQVSDQHLIKDAGTVLLMQGIIWIIFNCLPGLIFKTLAPLSYYPRMAWWNLYCNLLTSAAPVIAVVFGADLLTAGIVSALASFIFSIPLYVDLFALLKKEKISYNGLFLKFGLQNFIFSLAVSTRGLLENLRQEGVRIIVSPFIGVAGLTSFSTMRTGSNIASQGLNTIVYPIMPELMRFLHNKDQERSEVAFGTIWFVLVAVMAPGIVVLQIIIKPLFTIWTHGKVIFNPPLFAAFSLTVLIYAVSQPAIAVVKGNNLLKSQLLISIVACVIVISGIIISIPMIGINGAGIALIAGETFAAIRYKSIAKNWLKKNGLRWPSGAASIAFHSICISGLSVISLILFPGFIFLILTISAALFCYNTWRYWKILPDLATNKANRFLKYFRYL
jgi:O-antigen/teichoic acid export membrane protein